MWMSIIAFSATAQTTQLATLQHQDQVSIFYGAESLKQAVAAASDGDVITLSAGQFDAPTFDKELTVRGAGMGIIDAPGYSIPTIINGDSQLNANLTFEGIKWIGIMNVYANVALQKSDIKCLLGRTSSESQFSTFNIISCVINQLSGIEKVHVTTINSMIKMPSLQAFSSNTRLTAINCHYVLGNSQDTKGLYIYGGTFTNCTIHMLNRLNTFYTNSVAYNSLIYGSVNTKIESNPTNTNAIRRDLTTVFKDEGFYELLDEFKSFATTDGTEVGIYGGNLGFTQTPNNPQITKFTVAPRTSADGKLSVEIQVEGME